MFNKWIAAGLAAAVACVLCLPAYAILPIQQWQTPSGARVYFVENRDLPMLDVSVEFPAGSAYDTAQKAGTAAMANRLMNLGAGGMSDASRTPFAKRSWSSRG